MALVLSGVAGAWFLAFWLILPVAARRNWGVELIDDEDDSPQVLPGD
jgi:hypothetical protein